MYGSQTTRKIFGHLNSFADEWVRLLLLFLFFHFINSFIYHVRNIGPNRVSRARDLEKSPGAVYYRVVDFSLVKPKADKSVWLIFKAYLGLINIWKQVN